MPTLLLIDGFRFFFYSMENNEPVHVHVSKGDAVGKIWLEPEIAVAYFYRFNVQEAKAIIQIINKYHEQFKTKWNEYFNK